MYTLTVEKTKEGKPVAIIKGGGANGGIVSILEVSKASHLKFSKLLQQPFNVEDHTQAFENVKGKAKKRLQEDVHLLMTEPDAINYVKDNRALDAYRNIRNNSKQLGQPVKRLELQDDGRFQIYPNPKKDEFEMLYIVGASGSGKSTVALHYTEEYHKLFPDNEIYLISSLKEDKTLDKNKHIKRINLQSFLEDKPTLDEFANSLVVFDDYETLEYTNKKLYAVVMGLISEFASMARHKNARAICIQHKFTNGNYTRLLLAEATHYVIYPRTASAHNLKLLCGEYGCMNPKQIASLQSLPTRWVCIHKNFPPFMITETSVELIN
jgi:hypothetical protein